MMKIGYIKITSSIDGVIQDREHIIQVVVKNITQTEQKVNVKIFDGISEEITMFRYGWKEFETPILHDTISEGVGNGNGKAEIGEVFSVWIQPPSAYDSLDVYTWHPSVLINQKGNTDISIEEIIQHHFNKGRPVLSAQIRLNRNPTKEMPVIIPLELELLRINRLKNHCHRDVADDFVYCYYEIIINEYGVAECRMQY